MNTDSKIKIALYSLPVVCLAFFALGAVGIGLPGDWNSATGWESMPWDTNGEAALKFFGQHANAILFGLAAALLALVFPILQTERDGLKSALLVILFIGASLFAGLLGYAQAVWLFHL